MLHNFFLSHVRTSLEELRHCVSPAVCEQAAPSSESATCLAVEYLALRHVPLATPVFSRRCLHLQSVLPSRDGFK